MILKKDMGVADQSFDTRVHRQNPYTMLPTRLRREPRATNRLIRCHIILMVEVTDGRRTCRLMSAHRLIQLWGSPPHPHLADRRPLITPLILRLPLISKASLEAWGNGIPPVIPVEKI